MSGRQSPLKSMKAFELGVEMGSVYEGSLQLESSAEVSTYFEKKD